jgi:hypothetical protein
MLFHYLNKSNILNFGVNYLIILYYYKNNLNITKYLVKNPNFIDFN